MRKQTNADYYPFQGLWSPLNAYWIRPPIAASTLIPAGPSSAFISAAGRMTRLLHAGGPN